MVDFERGYKRAIDDAIATLGFLALEYDGLASSYWDEYQETDDSDLRKYWNSAKKQSDGYLLAMGLINPGYFYFIEDGSLKKKAVADD